MSDTLPAPIPPRPPHEVAALISAIVGGLGAAGLLDRWGMTADQVAMVLCWSFAAVASVYGLLAPKVNP